MNSYYTVVDLLRDLLPGCSSRTCYSFFFKTVFYLMYFQCNTIYICEIWCTNKSINLIIHSLNPSFESTYRHKKFLKVSIAFGKYLGILLRFTRNLHQVLMLQDCSKWYLSCSHSSPSGITGNYFVINTALMLHRKTLWS